MPIGDLSPIEFCKLQGSSCCTQTLPWKDERKLVIGRYPVHAESFGRLLGDPSLAFVFDDRSTALP
jgi:hypothetical protein